MNWNTIANVSSIVTCTTFVIYLIGRICMICRQTKRKTETMSFEAEEDLQMKEVLDNTNYLDMAGMCGKTFSIMSPEGIQQIKIFEIKPFNKPSKSNIRHIKRHLEPNEKFYIRAEFYDVGSNVYIEMLRADYVKTQFIVADSGRNGSFVAEVYQNHTTLRSILYYLFQ